MRKLTIFFVIFNYFAAYGQEAKEVRSVDTLKTITLIAPSDLDITYLTKDREFRFSRTQTIRIFSDLLSEMKKELNPSNEVIEWKREQLGEYEKVFEYIKEQKQLILSNPFEKDTIKAKKQISENISSMTALCFYEIACEMFDSGDLMIIENGKRHEKLIKAEVYIGDKYSGRTSIKYLTTDGNEIWECPPIIEDDY